MRGPGKVVERRRFGGANPLPSRASAANTKTAASIEAPPPPSASAAAAAALAQVEDSGATATTVVKLPGSGPVTKAAVFEALCPQQLTRAATAAALRGGGPVVLRGAWLSPCKLVPLPETSSSPFKGRDADGDADGDDDCPLPWQQKQRQDADEHAAPTAASASASPVRVYASAATHARFMTAADPEKNAPGSYYEVRRPPDHGAVPPLQGVATLKEWQRRARAWRATKLLATADVCAWRLPPPGAESTEALAAAAAEGVPPSPAGARVWPNAGVWPELSQMLQLQQASHSLAAAAAPASTPPSSLAERLLDWQQLKWLIEAGGWSPAGSVALQAGSPDAVLPARYERHDAFIAQLSGARRVLLVPPEAAFRGLPPYPCAHMFDGYSCCADLNAALEAAGDACGMWPRAAEWAAAAAVVDLAPGDALLVPAYWYAHARLLPAPAAAAANGGGVAGGGDGDSSVALLVRLQPLASGAGARAPSAGALQLQAGRMVEAVVAAEAGVANVRRWLLALARGREWDWIDLSTPAGCRRLRMCEEALQRARAALQPLSSTELRGLVSAAARALGHANDGEGGGAGAAGQASLLERAARAFLALVCDGRLVPTDWLNEGVNEPRYALPAPDAEAAAYPELFRHRLPAARSDWRAVATLLPPRAPRALALHHSGGGNSGSLLLREGTVAAATASGDSA